MMMTEYVECYIYSRLLYDSRNIGCLVFQDKANAIQEFVRNANDSLVLWHSSAELVEGQHQSGIFPDSDPGTLDDQTSEERIASLGMPVVISRSPLEYSPGMPIS